MSNYHADMSVVINIILAAIAALAAAAAFWQAVEARRARQEARTAETGSRSARDEAAELAAEANRIAERSLEAQEKSLPPVWSVPIETSKNRVGFENQSSRHVVIESVEVDPTESENFVRTVVDLPVRIEYGDMFQLMVLGSMQMSPEKIILNWRFEDEDEMRVTERMVA